MHSVPTPWGGHFSVGILPCPYSGVQVDSAFLDSRICGNDGSGNDGSGNDGGMTLPRKRLILFVTQEITTILILESSLKTARLWQAVFRLQS